MVQKTLPYTYGYAVLVYTYGMYYTCTVGHEQMLEHSNVRSFMQHSSVDFCIQTFIDCIYG